VSIREAVPIVARELAIRHASELSSGAWDASYDLQRLVELSHDSGLSIVTSIIVALRERAIDVSSAAWMNFANVIARTDTVTQYA
jgi:hypothetical protein